MCPCQPSGRPSNRRTQSTTRSSSSVDAGDARHVIATWFSAAAISSAAIPGSPAVTAKYAKKRGCCQFVSAGTISSSRSPKHVRERLALLRRRERQLRGQVARLDLREHGQLVDPLEVVRRPVDSRATVFTERQGFFRRIFSTCFQVRVLTRSSLVSQPRRAC